MDNHITPQVAFVMEVIGLDKLNNGAGQLKMLGWSREKVIEQINVVFGALDEIGAPTMEVDDPTQLKPVAPTPDYRTSS